MNKSFAARAAAFILAALAALLPARSCPASGSEEITQTRWVICQTYVHIRARPGSDSDSIGRLYCGDEISINQTVKRGRSSWHHCVDLANEYGSGWVCADYCTDSAVTECDQTATVSASGRVALRTSVNGSRIRWARPGDRVTVIAVSDLWSLTGKGYIKTQYLIFHDDQSPTITNEQ